MISGLATEEQTEKAMENVYEKLNTKFGAILMDPPYHKEAFEGALAVIYNAGTKENTCNRCTLQSGHSKLPVNHTG